MEKKSFDENIRKKKKKQSVGVRDVIVEELMSFE